MVLRSRVLRCRRPYISATACVCASSCNTGPRTDQKSYHERSSNGYGSVKTYQLTQNSFCRRQTRSNNSSCISQHQSDVRLYSSLSSGSQYLEGDRHSVRDLNLILRGMSIENTSKAWELWTEYIFSGNNSLVASALITRERLYERLSQFGEWEKLTTMVKAIPAEYCTVSDFLRQGQALIEAGTLDTEEGSVLCEYFAKAAQSLDEHRYFELVNRFISSVVLAPRDSVDYGSALNIWLLVHRLQGSPGISNYSKHILQRIILGCSVNPRYQREYESKASGIMGLRGLYEFLKNPNVASCETMTSFYSDQSVTNDYLNPLICTLVSNLDLYKESTSLVITSLIDISRHYNHLVKATHILWDLKVSKKCQTKQDLYYLLSSHSFTGDIEQAVNHYLHLTRDSSLSAQEATRIALIKSYDLSRDYNSLHSYFGKILSEGYKPTQDIYRLAFKSATRMSDFRATRKLLQHMGDNGVMPTSDIIDYALSSAANSGHIDIMERLFNQMFSRWSIQPSARTYRIILRAYRNSGDLPKCYAVIEEMREGGHELDDKHVEHVLVACSRLRDWNSGSKFFQFAKSNNLPLNTQSYSCLIQCAIASGLRYEAAALYSDFVRSGGKPTSSMITAILQYHTKYNDQQFFRYYLSEFMRYNLSPSPSWYYFVIKHFAAVGNPKAAEETFKNMKISGIKPTTHHYSALIDAHVTDRNAYRAADLLKECYDAGNPASFKLHENYLRVILKSFRYKAKPEGMELGFDYLYPFLSKERIVDFGSHDLRQDRLPVKMVRDTFRQLLKGKRASKALQIIEHFSGDYYLETKDRYLVSQLLVEYFAALNHYENVSAYFQKFLDNIREHYVLIDGKLRLPEPLSRDFSRIIYAKLKQLVNAGEYHSITPLMTSLAAEGFTIDNRQVNYITRVFLAMPQYALVAFKWIEEELFEGYQVRLKLRKQLKRNTPGRAPKLLPKHRSYLSGIKYHASHKTVLMMFRGYPRAVAALMEKEKLSMEEARGRFSSMFPRLSRMYPILRRMRDRKKLRDQKKLLAKEKLMQL